MPRGVKKPDYFAELQAIEAQMAQLQEKREELLGRKRAVDAGLLIDFLSQNGISATEVPNLLDIAAASANPPTIEV